MGKIEILAQWKVALDRADKIENYRDRREVVAGINARFAALYDAAAA